MMDVDTGAEVEKILSFEEYEIEYERCLQAEVTLFKSAVSSLAQVYQSKAEAPAVARFLV